ncbi:MAG: hypothetical protein OEW62_05120, partial [Candidatus Bathyarchaeota archaeon]|nr:hypothetical protein [Candidatus Bathyarchaeota archaeon]
RNDQLLASNGRLQTVYSVWHTSMDINGIGRKVLSETTIDMCIRNRLYTLNESGKKRARLD